MEYDSRVRMIYLCAIYAHKDLSKKKKKTTMSDTEPCPVQDEITDDLGVQFWFLTNTNALSQQVAPSQEIMQETKFLADVKKQTATISQPGHADRSVNH